MVMYSTFNVEGPGAAEKDDGDEKGEVVDVAKLVG
jgi:hypothetical protein